MRRGITSKVQIVLNISRIGFVTPINHFSIDGSQSPKGSKSSTLKKAKVHQVLLLPLKLVLRMRRIRDRRVRGSMHNLGDSLIICCVISLVIIYCRAFKKSAFKASSNNGKKGGSGKGGGGDPDSDPIKEIWKRLPLIMGASLAAAVFVASGLVGDRSDDLANYLSFSHHVSFYFIFYALRYVVYTGMR